MSEKFNTIPTHILEFPEGTMTIQETQPGIFEITEQTITKNDPNCHLTLYGWDTSVTELVEKESDKLEYEYAPKHVRWEDVTIDFRLVDENNQDKSPMFIAPSLDRIKEALKHVKINYVDIGDI
jgi:hypothetical protein